MTSHGLPTYDPNIYCHYEEKSFGILLLVIPEPRIVMDKISQLFTTLRF